MLVSVQMGEKLSTAPGSDLESKLGMPLSCVEQNVNDTPINRAPHLSFAFRGWKRARLSKYYVEPRREQLEAQMNWAGWGACGITGQLTDRLEVDAELCGWLATHDGYTVYKHKKEAGGKRKK